MRAAWYLARAELRRSWKGASAVVLVLGILWGLTIGFAVGARRNATAFRRMIVATRAVDILVNAQLGAGSALDFDAVTHLPEVDEYDGIDGYFATVNTDDPAAADADGAALWLSTRRGVLGQQFERTLLLEGRRLDPKGADEILVNPEFTRRFRVGVGDQFTFSLFDPQANRPIVVAHRTMRVVGVCAGWSM